ncbi:MAG: hypothetical protein ABI797_03715, partial [Chloroflexota bacterium]
QAVADTEIDPTLTGPAAAIFGNGETMVLGALAGAALTILLLFVPGVRDPERVKPPAAKGLVVATNPEQDAL